MEPADRSRPPWFRPLWHTLSLATVLVVPAAVAFGEAFWSLPGTHGRLAWGLGGAYLASVLALAGWRRLLGRPRLSVRATAALAALSVLYLAFLLRPDPEYSRLLLVLGSVLVVGGVLGPPLVPLSGRFVVAAPAALCAGAVGLLLTQGWEDRVRAAKFEVTSEPGADTAFLRSSRHTLAAITYSDALPPPREPRVSGGAIARFPGGDGYLHVRARGPLYRLTFDRDGRIHARKLGTSVPINNDAFEADVGPEVNVKWFRVAGLLAWREEDGVRLLASHHHWKRDDGCFVVRLSATTLRVTGGGDRVVPGTWETIYDTSPCLPVEEEGGGAQFGGLQIGGRLARLEDGRIVVTVGDHKLDGRGGEPVLPQEAEVDYGKTLLVDVSEKTAEVFTLGHRNPQGLAVGSDGAIWETEHGPEGGDELNRLRRHANYGWPYHTYGTEYGDAAWPLSAPEELDTHVLPEYTWVPSIGVTNLVALDGSAFPRWRGDLLVGSLAAQSLWRVALDGNRGVAFAEPIELGERIRDIEKGQDEIVLLTDWGQIVRLRPATGLSEGASAFHRLCGGCHVSRAGEKHGIGPSLRGVVGRGVASAPGFDYSAALREMEGTWTEARLDRFLADPRGTAPGTAMAIGGIEDPETRRAVIDYLRSRE